eukprot:jgi/Mesen1/9424/ME000618S08813
MGGCVSTDPGTRVRNGSPTKRLSPRSRVASSPGGQKGAGGPLSDRLEEERRADEALARLPDRCTTSGSMKNVSMHSEGGQKGPNQDAMLLWENFMERGRCTLVAVFDGHGPQGDLVAARVRDSLPSKLARTFHAFASPPPDGGAGAMPALTPPTVMA